MKRDQWEVIEEIFHAALEVQGTDRSRLIEERCGSDEFIRRNVELLLQQDDNGTDFLNRSAVEMFRVRLAPGTLIGPYEILDIAGAGGMGQVYRARDSRLKRTVAIKALPAEFARDKNRLASFEREATMLASLNHPNIAGIYDIIEIEDRKYLVLEFVDGATLGERLQSGPIPVDETLRIAQKIASALVAAHEKGIVHRDLKPSNIKVAADGTVKVLDFGIAKILAALQSDTELPVAAALANMSERSLSMGTPGYMSPEQIQGKPIDSRADIWAFGCVLYELLTARKAFPAERQPGSLQQELSQFPKQLARLIHQCLEERREVRLQSAGDLREALGAIQVNARRVNPLRARMTLLAGGILAAAVVLGAAYLGRRGSGAESVPVRNLHVVGIKQRTFAAEFELDPAYSPNGEEIAYVGGTTDRMDIFARKISDGPPRNLTKDLKSAYNRWPRWSPDGESLAFVSNSSPLSQKGGSLWNGHTIQIVSPAGGQVRPLVISGVLGHTWSPDGTKLAYFRDYNLHVTTVATGVSREIASALPEPHSPSWSPNGKWIAFVAGNPEAVFQRSTLGNVAGSGIMLVEATGGEPHVLTDSRTGNLSPVWMPDSHSLLFISTRYGSRDVYELRISDTGTAVGEPVRVSGGLDALSIDLSKDGGQLVYANFTMKSNIATLPIPGVPPVSSTTATRLTTGSEAIESANATRDGQWILYDSNLQGNQDIFKKSRITGLVTQLTQSPQDDFQPNLSPDGQTIAFYSFRNGNRDLYVMSTDGTKQEQLTSDPAQERYPDWSPDSKSLVFYSDKTGKNEIYRMSRENGRWSTPVPMTSNKRGAMQPRWARNGESIAYVDEQGLMLMPSTGGPAKVLVPKRPDLLPAYIAWSRDSKTIYFRAGNGRQRMNIWSVPAAGGQPTMLVRFEDASRFEFSTDDKSFFFTLADRESDIWSLHLER